MINYAKCIQEKTIISPITILEIGSRDAEDAFALQDFFKITNDNVYIVEPHPGQQKIISLKYPNFNLIPNAIYNKEGKLKFNAVNDDNKDFVGQSSLLDKYNGFYKKVLTDVIEVDVITGEKLINDINKEIDLCKIDVEGVTFEVLESFGKSLSKIKSMHLECEHLQIWKGQKLYVHIKRYLEDNNFKQIFFECANSVNPFPNIPFSIIQQSDSIWVNKNLLK